MGYGDHIHMRHSRDFTSGRKAEIRVAVLNLLLHEKEANLYG
jgi:hypothetical protein